MSESPPPGGVFRPLTLVAERFAKSPTRVLTMAIFLIGLCALLALLTESWCQLQFPPTVHDWLWYLGLSLTMLGGSWSLAYYLCITRPLRLKEREVKQRATEQAEQVQDDTILADLMAAADGLATSAKALRAEPAIAGLDQHWRNHEVAVLSARHGPSWLLLPVAERQRRLLQILRDQRDPRRVVLEGIRASDEPLHALRVPMSAAVHDLLSADIITQVGEADHHGITVVLWPWAAELVLAQR